MKVDKSTPTSTITVQGIQLEAPAPYAEGHPLTTNEAIVLNQTLAENLRNNFASVVKKAKTDAPEGAELDVASIQAEFDKYVEEYEFGVRRGGARIVDPIERQAVAIAKDTVKAALKANGYSIKGENGIGDEKFNEMVAAYAVKPEVVKEAKRQVNATKKLALDELGL